MGQLMDIFVQKQNIEFLLQKTFQLALTPEWRNLLWKNWVVALLYISYFSLYSIIPYVAIFLTRNSESTHK